MIGTFTYYFCDGGTCGSREVSLATLSACTFSYTDGSHEAGQDYCDHSLETIRFNLNSAAPVPIRIYFQQDFTDFSTWDGETTYVIDGYVDIPSGSTYFDYQFHCAIECGVNADGGGYGYENQYKENTRIVEQPSLPACCLDPDPEPTGVTCTLAITSYDIADCVISGDSNGRIDVTITGASGNTSWYLNDVLIVSDYAFNDYSFTGLPAGEYTVRVVDSNTCEDTGTYTVNDGLYLVNTYFYCDGGTCGSREIGVVVQTPCHFDHTEGSHEPNEDYCDYSLETIRFTIDSPSPVPIRVYYMVDVTTYNTWDGTATYVLNEYIDIPSGVTYYDYINYCAIECGVNMDAGGYGYDNQYRTNIRLKAQPTLPSCCLEPTGVTCTITITDYTITDCIVRGDNSGSVEVTISGASGSTSWYLQGDLIVSGYTAQTYTFTGLTAGIYSISITDDNDCTTQDSYTILDGEFRTGDFNVVSPTVVTAVENPIIISVATAIANASPKVNITTITVTNTITDNSTITFNLTSPFVYNQTFYSKSYPNKQNYFLSSTLKNQFGIDVGSNTTTEITTSLADALNNDSVIPKIYYINNSENVIRLIAKQIGSRFNLNSGNVISSNSNIVVSQLQAGLDAYDGQITDNYSISCEVMANTDTTNQYPMTGDTTDYNRIAELVLPFAENNRHFFDISQILKSQVSTPRPNTALTGATYISTAMQPYYCKLSELYPLVANTNTVKKRYKTETQVQWVINSSLDRYVANDMSLYTTTPVKFLTNSPNPKQIQRNSKEFLYFVLPKNYGTNLDVRGDMYFYDGTEVTGVTFFSISTGTTNIGGVMCLNISYDKLGLVNYEVSGSTNRKIKRLELAVYANNGTVQYTEKKKYKFEIDEMPRKFGVFFQNSLGMYDEIDFIGVVEETINREVGNYTIPIPYALNGSMNYAQKHTATYDTRVTKKIVSNTGWIDENHFDWLMEMMKTNNIYNANVLTSHYLNLTDFKYIKSSLDDLFEVEVTFEYTIYENNINV